MTYILTVVAQREATSLTPALLNQIRNAVRGAPPEVLSAGEAEVVEEAVFDRGADVVLGAGKQINHGCGHQVGGAVAQDLKGRLGRCWEWCACLSGVVDDLVWHAMPILRSPRDRAL